MKRAGFYFDGFNVYHAICSILRPHLKWVSYCALADRLKAADEEVSIVKVFSAIANWKPLSANRHHAFNRANRHYGAKIILGSFKGRSESCRNCKATWTGHEEKESDVNLALQLLDDCYRDLIDVAYIITTDSDLTPAAALVRTRFPGMDLVTVSCLGRSHSKEILKVCQRKANISEQLLERCLMPEEILDEQGNTIAVRPKEYDPPT
jgi:uncharacterized LabA/DUF88 family protein